MNTRMISLKTKPSEKPAKNVSNYLPENYASNEDESTVNDRYVIKITDKEPFDNSKTSEARKAWKKVGKWTENRQKSDNSNRFALGKSGKTSAVFRRADPKIECGSLK